MNAMEENCMQDAQARRIVERLAAGIQHEINSPLGALACAADSMTRVVRRYRAALADPATAGTDRAQTADALGSVDALCAVIDASTRRISEVVRGLEQLGPRLGTDHGLDRLEAALHLVEHGGSLRLAAALERGSAAKSVLD